MDLHPTPEPQQPEQEPFRPFVYRAPHDSTPTPADTPQRRSTDDPPTPASS